MPWLPAAACAVLAASCSVRAKTYKPAGGESENIHAAFKAGDMAKVKALTSMWGSPEEIDQVQSAAYKGDDGQVEALLRVSPGLVNAERALDENSSGTPLHIASSRGHTAVVQVLLAHKAPVNARNRAGATPLQLAAANGRLGPAQCLLRKGADVNAQDDRGVSPLHAAVVAGNEGVVGILLSRGANVNAQDAAGSTPLHLAAARGLRAIVRDLLKHRADPNMPDENGGTALHVAAKGGHAEVVKSLLGARADAGVRERILGWTPLFEAVSNGHTAVVRLLLAAGADKDIRDKRGRTVLQDAKESGRRDIVALLEKRSARRKSVF
jgi:ankyrin repeat protein